MRRLCLAVKIFSALDFFRAKGQATRARKNPPPEFGGGFSRDRAHSGRQTGAAKLLCAILIKRQTLFINKKPNYWSWALNSTRLRVSGWKPSGRYSLH